jgi:UDP-3-O-[3-hydroxymyristoyl] N-acetylglucosamine deacetylase
MAAFFGLGIDHAVVSVDGEELPILDGSSASFLTLLDEAGVEELSTPKKLRVMTKAIEIVDDKDPQKFIRIEPSREPLISYSVQFDIKAIGEQILTIPWNAASFCEQTAFARTFCLEEEVLYMQSKGLARGGSLQNAVVFSREKGVLNQQGLRDEHECVRHKILDCIGDLYLLGTPILGHVMANKAGHDLHTRLAAAILAQTDASHMVTLGKGATNNTHRTLVAPQSLSELKISFNGLALG